MVAEAFLVSGKRTPVDDTVGRSARFDQMMGRHRHQQSWMTPVSKHRRRRSTVG